MTLTAGDRPIPIGHHIRRTFALAAPIILARAGIIVITTVDTIMTGWAGADELAYLALALATQVSLMMVAIGALQAAAVMTAQAIGAGDDAMVGNVLRVALVHAFLFAFAILIITPFSQDFFLLTGQNEDLAAGAAAVTFAFAVGLPGFLVFMVCNMFLEAIGRPKAGMVVMLAVNLANVPLNGVMALGWGGLLEPLGAEGATFASSILRTFAGLAILVIVFRSTARGGRFLLSAGARQWADAVLRLGGATGRQLRHLGLPMGIAQGVESAAFATVVMFAGLIGANDLAAYQIVTGFVTLTFMMAVGTSGATAIRVGRAFGAGERAAMRHAGWAGIGLGALLPVPVMLAFLFVPETLAGLITGDAQVIAIAVQAFAVAAFMLSGDAGMGVALGALRGLGDVWVPTLLQIAAFWLFAIPSAWVGGVALDLGVSGLFGGLLAGVCISFLCLAVRFQVVSRRS
ncbi:MATE family efflux transporter [Rhizobiales bacterium]|uniref:MATE family efflux transporter n=1 Tax=Hongsoonwoonella zoysiae TaxID=2821844 RepID=UPI0015600CA9|nr:MATE family efflux transporter [Hongsoonwoonella zoysiae]NRG16580.1 MATE family efflux transporter [Hongsoonwoonella zoysiae]